MANANNTAPQGENQAVSRFPVERLDIRKAFDNPPPPLDFVLPGFLAGTVGGLVSPGGVGKSSLALQIAADIATDANTTGLNIDKRGAVVMLAGEDPAEVLGGRIHALKSRLDDRQREEFADRFHLFPLVGEGFDLLREKSIIQGEIKRLVARLLVIDTLTRFHGLDENRAEDAKTIMQALEAVAHASGCAVLYLHHVNKSAALNGMADLQQAARGSSVFVDNARWLSYVACCSDEEAKEFSIDADLRRHWLRFNISKQNYGPPIPDQWFRRDASVLEPSQPVKAAKKGGFRGNV